MPQITWLGVTYNYVRWVAEWVNNLLEGPVELDPGANDSNPRSKMGDRQPVLRCPGPGRRALGVRIGRHCSWHGGGSGR